MIRIGRLCTMLIAFCIRMRSRSGKKSLPDEGCSNEASVWQVWLDQGSERSRFLVLGPVKHIGLLLSLETIPEGWSCQRIEGDAIGLDVPATADAALKLDELLDHVSNYEITDEAQEWLSELTILDVNEGWYDV